MHHQYAYAPTLIPIESCWRYTNQSRCRSRSKGPSLRHARAAPFDLAAAVLVVSIKVYIDIHSYRQQRPRTVALASCLMVLATRRSHCRIQQLDRNVQTAALASAATQSD